MITISDKKRLGKKGTLLKNSQLLKSTFLIMSAKFQKPCFLIGLSFKSGFISTHWYNDLSWYLFSTQIVHSLLSSQLNIWIALTKLTTIYKILKFWTILLRYLKALPIGSMSSLLTVFLKLTYLTVTKVFKCDFRMNFTPMQWLSKKPNVLDFSYSGQVSNFNRFRSILIKK